jgi:hypothetical protein
MPPFKCKRGVFQLLGGLDKGGAGGVEAQPFRQPVKQGRAAKSRFERSKAAADRRLA